MWGVCRVRVRGLEHVHLRHRLPRACHKRLDHLAAVRGSECAVSVLCSAVCTCCIALFRCVKGETCDGCWVPCTVQSPTCPVCCVPCVVHRVSSGVPCARGGGERVPPIPGLRELVLAEVDGGDHGDLEQRRDLCGRRGRVRANARGVPRDTAEYASMSSSPARQNPTVAMVSVGKKCGRRAAMCADRLYPA